MKEIRQKLGKLLKLERERQQISLEELAKDLKISDENLDCIETGDISGLPSEIYYNLFAKTYAEALGIDYNRTIEAIKEEIGETLEPLENKKTTEPGEDQKEKSPKSKENSKEESSEDSLVQFKKLGKILALIIIVFLVFLGLNKIFNSDGEPEQTSPPPEDTEITHDIDEESTSDDSPYASYDWNTTNYKKPEPFTLKMVSQRESWSTVIADGDTAIFRNLTPNRIYEVTAKYRMRVSVAVPSVVNIELNGKPVNFINPATGRISKVEITQINIDSILTRADSRPPAPVVERNPETVTKDDNPIDVVSPEVTPVDTSTIDKSSENES